MVGGVVMAKPKKDGRHINYYLDRQVYKALESYAEEKGQTMTMALERIVRDYLKIEPAIKTGIDKEVEENR